MSLCVLAATLFGAPKAEANSRYAALVVHAETGDVLFDRYSNDTRYPASLTKMMTLYLLFEAIEAGELSLDSELKVSKRASYQPASKLGLKAGSTITVSQAIDALIIKSANDVATVVSEALGGTESRFATRMTRRARQLGMSRTVFRNASGLPNSRQVTTARDMAVLSRRVVQDFPQHWDRFSRTSFTYGGRTYRSHNRVMLSLDGADGLKTGYTRASGYNLATTAERGDHRLIGIVLGGRSSATRDRHMKDIINAAFVQIRRKPDLVSPIFAARPEPTLKPGRAAPVVAVASLKPTTAADSQADALTLAAAGPLGDASPATDLNMARLQAVIAEVESDVRALDEAVYGQGDADPIEARDWLIQVGAYSKQTQAFASIRAVQDQVLAVQPEAGREVNIADRRGAAVYRARFTGLTASEASAGCAALKGAGEDCLALRVAE